MLDKRAIVQDLRVTRPRGLPALLALNNASRTETSELDAVTLAHLLDEAFLALATPEATALLIAFDETARYDSPNFLWFRKSFDRFVYVDRVIVASAERGHGIARQLYDTLFAAARAGNHVRIVCEVNLDPPNAASDAFHASLGFTEIGRATLANGKTVRYLERALTG